MFLIFSALFGFTMSIYLLIYDLTSLVFAFLATALYFGVLAAYGRLTGRDLSGIRPILFSGLLFLVIFGVISLFIPALSLFDSISCLIGIAVFLGYTAYDTQRIRAFYHYYAGYPDMLEKASIFAALQLYLDFVNLFLYLLPGSWADAGIDQRRAASGPRLRQGVRGPLLFRGPSARAPTPPDRTGPWGPAAEWAARLGRAISALHRSTSCHRGETSATAPRTVHRRNTAR